MPQLGTFIVKVPEGGVVFSELLRRDDGILRGLLVQQGGMNDLEAAGAIDRFVFEVRHALEHEGAYAIEGFGRHPFAGRCHRLSGGSGHACSCGICCRGIGSGGRK